MSKESQETIIVMGAHTDDFVIGAGGTIANYTNEGKKVIAIVFSYGEMSHPWMKENVVKKFRAEETFTATRTLSCNFIFFDLKEGKFLETYREKDVDKKIIEIIKKEKPSKIFTHSLEDPHPDHKAAHKITMAVFEKLTKKPEVYVYSVWNPVSFKTDYPSLYVDISKTFSKKLKALKDFKSQKIHVAYPFLLLLYKNIKDGFKIRKRFGEHFYRIK